MIRFYPSFAKVVIFLSILIGLEAAADTVLVDASGINGTLDVSAEGETVEVSNIENLTAIQTASGQRVILDGDELQGLSDADNTLTVLGEGHVDITNANLVLPNDGTVPSVNNLLALEFSGLDSLNSIVPTRLTVDDSHIKAIAAFWIQLDAQYVGSGDYYNLDINTSFVYLGNDYVSYLADGNQVALDIVKVSGGRLQTLHDNLLGNLGDGPIASRFTNLGAEEPRTDLAETYGSRLYHDGSASTVYSNFEIVSSTIGWDLSRSLAYPSALPSPFADFDASNNLTGDSNDQSFFGGGANDSITGGDGIDSAGFRGQINDYLITNDGSNFVVTDSVANRDGADTLSEVEKLSFSDGSIYLVGDNDFTIQAAIDAADDNDLIYVLPGDYTESISVSKSISLLGAQAGVDARSRTGAAESSLTGVIQLLADADNVTIDGFSILEGATIGGENAGIFVGSGAAGTIIRNTIFTRSGDVDGDTYRGIVTTLNGGNTDLQIAQNRFSGWATGLYLNPAATDAAVSNNDFIGNFVGMSVDGPDNATISDNHFTDNQFEAGDWPRC